MLTNLYALCEVGHENNATDMQNSKLLVSKVIMLLLNKQCDSIVWMDVCYVLTNLYEICKVKHENNDKDMQKSKTFLSKAQKTFYCIL